jgi:hypothetical protein
MGTYRFALSIQIRHPSADLLPIAQGISKTPDSIWKRGEQKVDKVGKPIGDPKRSSYCLYKIAVQAGDDLNMRLIEAIKLIEPVKDELVELYKSGGEANLFIGWFSDGDSGDIIDPQTLRTISDLGLSFDLDLYCGEDSVDNTDTHRFVVSVQIRHSSADLSPIAQSISRAPDSIWKRGEPKLDKSGQPTDYLRSSSYCLYKIPGQDKDDLSLKLTEAVKLIEPSKALLAELYRSDGKATLSIGWFSDANSRDVIQPQVLQDITALGLAIDLSIYCDEPPFLVPERGA